MLLAGQRPPEITGTFRVAWLGCDATFTPAVVAAVHPMAEVVAWDPDPAKVAMVRRLGDDAELANLVPHERPAPPVPDQRKFDIVVIDGLVDSVSDVERTRFTTAAMALLRPGGVTCVTYRTSVGWGEIAPVVQLLRYFALHPQRDRVRAVEGVKQLLNELRGAQDRLLCTPCRRRLARRLAGYVTQRHRRSVRRPGSPTGIPRTGSRAPIGGGCDLRGVHRPGSRPCATRCPRS